MKVWTTVTENEIQRRLFWATVMTFPAAALLLGTALFSSSTTLSEHGWLVWLIAMGLLAIAWVPYRKIERLAKNPHLLSVEEDEFLYLTTEKGKNQIAPLIAISHIKHTKKGGCSGLLLIFTEQHASPSLFLPQFSYRSCAQLEQFIHGDRSHQPFLS